MKPHPRIRKSVKWGGLAVAISLATAWCFSIRYDAFYYGRYITPRLTMGAFELGWTTEVNEPVFIPRFSGGITRSPTGVRLCWWPLLGRFGGAGLSGPYLIVPIWMPFIAVAAAATCAWRLDFRARWSAGAHACKSCGYDLRGLPDAAACPECGEKPGPSP